MPTRITEQALRFGALAPNIQVKIAGDRGRHARDRGGHRAAASTINATVCFTVPQALAVAEAVERGLDRHEAAGGDISTMSPVCTMMVGRLDDWLGVLVERDGDRSSPGHGLTGPGSPA